jgi:hypothetical protein
VPAKKDFNGRKFNGKTKNMKLLTLLLLSGWFSSFAQLRHYGTRDYTNFLKESGQTEKALTNEPTELKLPITISLTFILHTKEVSKDQLLKQITILNEDFGNKTFENAENKNSHYKDLATDTEIRFCENFQIIEAYSDEKMDYTLAYEYAKKHKTEIKNSIPVFITELDQMAGFAQPSGFASETEAIFIDKDYLYGSITEGFESGKTLTHLMGGYLGLGELWDCVDDGIADTPLMAAEHFEHESGWSSCYRYVVQTMPENFMYNTQDKYLNMFTLGQKKRMIQVLATEKVYLLESTTCK